MSNCRCTRHCECWDVGAFFVPKRRPPYLEMDMGSPVIVQSEGSSLTLEWVHSEGVDVEYEVFRCEVGGSIDVLRDEPIGVTGSTVFVDKDVSPGSYEYRVAVRESTYE